MASCNEMHGFQYELKATSSATVCYCITADQTLSLRFIVGDSDPVVFVFL